MSDLGLSIAVKIIGLFNRNEIVDNNLNIEIIIYIFLPIPK